MIWTSFSTCKSTHSSHWRISGPRPSALVPVEMFSKSFIAPTIAPQRGRGTHARHKRFPKRPGEPVPLFAHITAMPGVLPGQIRVLLRLATFLLTLTNITASRETEACELARLFERFGTDKLPVHHYQRAYCPILEPFRLSARIVVELGFFKGNG